MIFINHGNPKPLHEQIKDSVVEQIMLGVLSYGDRLPSVRDMALSLRIAPNTIQRAYRELETAGIITSQPGRGSFISIRSDGIQERRRQELLTNLKSLAGELKNLGVTEDEIINNIRHGG
jgi:GntR family transcriptional regulator